MTGRKQLLALFLCITLALAGCGDRSAPVAEKPEEPWVTSDRGVFSVQLVPANADAALVGQFSEWQLRVRSADGTPANGLRIDFVAAMPGHGHGMPSAPTVEPIDDAGGYAIRGVRLNMGGTWEFRLSLTSGSVVDELVIDRRIEF